MDFNKLALAYIRGFFTKKFKKDYTDQEILNNWPMAVEKLTENLKSSHDVKSGLTNVKKIKQDLQEIEFLDSGSDKIFTEDVLLLLPTPPRFRVYD